jgi:hypothetical protein
VKGWGLFFGVMIDFKLPKKIARYKKLPPKKKPKHSNKKLP